MHKRLVDKGPAGEGHAGSSPLSLCPSFPHPRLGQGSGPELCTRLWVYGHGLILPWDSVSWDGNYSSRWWMETSLKGKDRESNSTCPGPASTWERGPVQFPGDAIGAWWLGLYYNTCPFTRSVLCPEERGPQLFGSSPSCLEEKMIGFRNWKSRRPSTSSASLFHQQSVHPLQETHLDKDDLRCPAPGYPR